jgi:hypothetical protein
MPLDAHLPGDASGPIAIYGSIRDPSAASLELGYDDGTHVTIPVTEVSKPIGAGFFLYKLPAANRRAGHLPTKLTLFDNAGNPLTSATLPTSPLPRVGSHLGRPIPGFGTVSVPADAQFAARRLLFRTTVTLITPVGIRGGGTRRLRVGLWVAPSLTGGTCYWEGGLRAGGSGGCTASGQSQAAFLGASFFEDTLCCRVARGVTRVELRYQDGRRTELHPTQGYLLYALPVSQFRHGHRLTTIIGYDATGHVISSRTLPTDKPGMYPCAHPDVKIANVRMCS